ncbi:mitochondrial inner membrane protease subunit 2-like, partial [Dendrobium catenatum]|uniref:mitochondrial inner membrane protease subunit 2-like n=1 Tax=Dendrobium catenatum TaxID=906689 RepID=UPI0009F40F0A
PGYLKGDLVLIERFCLHDFKFSHGDVVIFQSPSNHKQIYVKRLIALPGEWIRVASDMLKIPDGHCWVEGDNSSSSLDSRYFGPVSYPRTVYLFHVAVKCKLILDARQLKWNASYCEVEDNMIINFIL